MIEFEENYELKNDIKELLEKHQFVDKLELAQVFINEITNLLSEVREEIDFYE